MRTPDQRIVGRARLPEGQDAGVFPLKVGDLTPQRFEVADRDLGIVDRLRVDDATAPPRQPEQRERARSGRLTLAPVPVNRSNANAQGLSNTMRRWITKIV